MNIHNIGKRRYNKRERRGGTLMSVCPGCKDLIHDNLTVENEVCIAANTKGYVVFHHGSEECRTAAEEWLSKCSNPPKFPPIRKVQDEENS